jgi:hypothetical protein
MRRVFRTFTALWQPMDDLATRNRRNNLTTGLIVCNLILCLIVGACWGLGVQPSAESWPYISFYAAEIVLILIFYAANAWFSRTIAANIVRSFAPPVEGSAVPPVDNPPPIPGFSIPLPVIGALNAMLVGFLTYFTGGPSNSPYAQILVAMLLVAEQTRNVDNSNHRDRPHRIIAVSLNEFRWFFALTALFYIPLGLLQWRYPVKVNTAPAGVTIGITAIIFLVGSVTNYLSVSARGRVTIMLPADDED